VSNLLTFSNGFSLELLYSGNEFQGIGTVRFRDSLLRSGEVPWTLYSESETEERGVRFEDFSLEKIEESGEEITLMLRSRGRWMPRIQEADAMGEARVRTRRIKAPEAIFRWSFRPVTEVIHEATWQGLAMRISFECPEAPIHWIMEAATWEIGGTAEGCRLIQQDVSTIQLEQEVQANSSFSTIEKFFTDGWGGSFPMDMMLRAAGAAICDFQAKGDTGLCLFAERPGHTRARLEKFADEAVIHYLDRAYFPLGTSVAAPERKLLVCQAPSPLERHEIRNLWLDCFTEVRRRIHAHFGFELEIPEPSSGAHLWDRELKELGASWPDAYERDFAEYARLGYRQLFLHGVWESITSDPNPPEEGNICCPYSFHFAEAFGGPERIKALAGTAHTHGMRLMQWFSFHLSRHAKIWKEHPDWVLREANGDPWDGNYHTLWSGRMRSGFAREFQAQIEGVMNDTGVDGIFWDSYHNLGVMGIDWGSPDKAPQADEIFHMQSALQRKGFRQWIEASTIFGVSRVGLFGFEDTKFRRRLWEDFVNGDQAYALLDTSPAFFLGHGEKFLTPDRLSPARYFWMAAHRVLPGLPSDPWEPGGERFPGGENAENYARVNRLYNLLRPYMHRLRLQPGGTHVLWLDQKGRPAVIWAFQQAEIPETEYLFDIETGECLSGHVQPGRAYGLGTHIDWFSLIEPAAASRESAGGGGFT
jgi:hypothetical protein